MNFHARSKSVPMPKKPKLTQGELDALDFERFTNELAERLAGEYAENPQIVKPRHRPFFFLPGKQESKSGHFRY